MKRIAVALLLALAPAALWAVDPTIVAPPEIDAYRIVRMSIKDKPEKAGLLWKIEPSDGRPAVVDNKPIIDWGTGKKVDKPEWVAPPGSYRITLLMVTGGDAPDISELTAFVKILGAAPVPPGPGPGPGPGPQPDGTNPFGNDPEFRVLMVFDPTPPRPYSGEQVAIMNGKEVIDFLEASTGADAQGWHNYRVWSKNTVPTVEDRVWQDAMAKTKAKNQFPYWMVGKGTTGVEGPLPATVKEAMDVLKRVRGQ